MCLPSVLRCCEEACNHFAVILNYHDCSAPPDYALSKTYAKGSEFIGATLWVALHLENHPSNLNSL